MTQGVVRLRAYTDRWDYQANTWSFVAPMGPSNEVAMPELPDHLLDTFWAASFRGMSAEMAYVPDGFSRVLDDAGRRFGIGGSLVSSTDADGCWASSVREGD